MRQRLVKLSALLLVGLMTVSVATSCGTKTATQSTTTSSSNSSSGVLTELKLPLVDKPTELTMVASWDSYLTQAGLSDLNQVVGLQEIEKKTGVHVKFTTFIQNYDENMTLLLSSRQLPDILERGWSPSQHPGGPAKALEDQVLIPLNDLIAKNAPNIRKQFEKYPKVAKLCKTDDGKIFMFPQASGPDSNNVGSGPQIRKDWLDKLNLKSPTTADEWYTVLKAFKEKDPNGNGKADEIPLYGPFNPLLMGMGGSDSWYQVNGQVKFGPLEPEFKTWVTLMNKWYKEGLIDQDYMTTDSKQYQAKITGNQMGAWSDYVSRIKVFNDLLTPTVKDAKIVGTTMPVMKAGDKPLNNYEGDPIAGLRGAGITPACKDPVLATKWLDYLYSPEGSMLAMYGVEGDSYTKNADGSIKLTDKITNDPGKLPINAAMGKYGLLFAKFEMIRDENYMKLNAPDPAQQEAVKLWTIDNQRRLPSVTPSADDASKFNNIMTDVNTVVKEKMNKFIMGQEPLENFDKFVSQLKDLRIDDAVKIQQKAYDAFQKR